MGCYSYIFLNEYQTKDDTAKMGGTCSKEKSTTDIDLFRDEDSDKDTATEFDFSEEYAFDDLISKVFTVGSDIIENDARGVKCGRITHADKFTDCLGGTFLSIRYMSIRSNGKLFYPSQSNTVICEYENQKDLFKLHVRPLSLEEKEKLQTRGKKFVEYGLGAHYMMYADKLFAQGPCGTRQVRAEGRVMVDCASFLHFNPDSYGMEDARRYGDDEDAMWGGGSKTCSRVIPDGSLHLCWPTLCGFSFKAKRWGEIALHHLHDIKFSEDAFDMLVLEKGCKDLVHGLVKNIHKEKQFTDIIQGKGGGCSFLLRGPPGVGKTLTAEAVSEVLHRPLYCVGVGELGVTPEMLEERLKGILEIAEIWNAVVLIDECDIFLASRTTDDVLRNAMVGIFLRLLEYYDGILFLTSNRADDLDEAFQSRVSVTVDYKALDAQTREQIWRNLLTAASIEHDAESLGVNLLAQYKMNGRQIKTAIRLATSLAEKDEESLTHKHLVQTIHYASAELSNVGASLQADTF